MKKLLLAGGARARGGCAGRHGGDREERERPTGKAPARRTWTATRRCPAISTTGDGKFKVKVNGDSVEYKLRYSGLSSPVKFAHIHFGREGVNGGVIAFLCGGGGKPACPASGEVTGTIVPADVVGPADQGIAAEPSEFAEFVRALKAGVTYANVHTDTFGER